MNMEDKIRTNPPMVMSVVEASIYLGVSDRKVRELVNTGEIRSKRTGKTHNSRILIKKEWLDHYLGREGE